MRKILWKKKQRAAGQKFSKLTNRTCQGTFLLEQISRIATPIAAFPTSSCISRWPDTFFNPNPWISIPLWVWMFSGCECFLSQLWSSVIMSNKTVSLTRFESVISYAFPFNWKNLSLLYPVFSSFLLLDGSWRTPNVIAQPIISYRWLSLSFYRIHNPSDISFINTLMSSQARIIAENFSIFWSSSFSSKWDVLRLEIESATKAIDGRM